MKQKSETLLLNIEGARMPRTIVWTCKVVWIFMMGVVRFFPTLKGHTWPRTITYHNISYTYMKNQRLLANVANLLPPCGRFGPERRQAQGDPLLRRTRLSGLGRVRTAQECLQELVQLKGLLDAGALTEEEFADLKVRLLRGD